MSGHTPGPWSARIVDDHEWHIDVNEPRLNDGMRFDWEGAAIVYGIEDSDELGSEIAEANARLIAAAPDLLEALKALYALDDGNIPALWDFAPDFAKARAAIAKAVGRS